MGSVNKVILVGNLGRDAELRYTPGGAAVATLNMATTEVWNDKAGQRQEKTEWHRVVLWGKSAESLNEYLTKGKQIYVEGRLQTRQWWRRWPRCGGGSQRAKRRHRRPRARAGRERAALRRRYTLLKFESEKSKCKRTASLLTAERSFSVLNSEF